MGGPTLIYLLYLARVESLCCFCTVERSSKARFGSIAFGLRSRAQLVTPPAERPTRGGFCARFDQAAGQKDHATRHNAAPPWAGTGTQFEPPNAAVLQQHAVSEVDRQRESEAGRPRCVRVRRARAAGCEALRCVRAGAGVCCPQVCRCSTQSDHLGQGEGGIFLLRCVCGEAGRCLVRARHAAFLGQRPASLSQQGLYIQANGCCQCVRYDLEAVYCKGCE